MPLKVRRWPQARIDQQDIWLSVAEDSIRAADGVIDRIDKIIFMLAEQPEAGRLATNCSQDSGTFQPAVT